MASYFSSASDQNRLQGIKLYVIFSNTSFLILMINSLKTIAVIVGTRGCQQNDTGAMEPQIAMLLSDITICLKCFSANQIAIFEVFFFF